MFNLSSDFFKIMLSLCVYYDLYGKRPDRKYSIIQVSFTQVFAVVISVTECVVSSKTTFDVSD